MKPIKKILEKVKDLTDCFPDGYDLKPYLKILLKENPSNNKPYHNLYHILCMTYLCYVIGDDDGLEYDDMRSLLLAALFHDFGHYSKNDAENVLKAIESFEKYSKENEEVNRDVIDNIKATQYPYVIDVNDLTRTQQIMRDADLLQWTRKNWIEQVIVGLSKEMEIPLKDFIDGYKKFILTSIFHTNKGREIFEKNIDKRMREVDYFKKEVVDRMA